MRSLFIHDPADLDATIPGGVQLCTHEFLSIVRAASIEVGLMSVTVSQAPTWRLRRKLGLGAYLFYSPEEARTRLTREISALQPTHIFLNRSELIRLAPLAAKLSPTSKIVVMSHGNQSGDDLYEISGPGGRRTSGLARWTSTWRIGLDLVTESTFRHHHLDGICVMSEEEEMLERWLGAKRIVVLPRIIRPRPVDWKPSPRRVGFVGTLNHTPNRVALELICSQLQTKVPAGFELRLAGGPEEAGRALAKKYAFITYVGRPDEEALRSEVASWSLFLNPIFWLSRGASMKLGQSLSWAVPSLTTRAGARGYQLSPDQTFMTDDTAEDFTARLITLISDRDALDTLRTKLLQSGPHWPDATSIAQRLQSALG
jgi:hypothetical protein